MARSTYRLNQSIGVINLLLRRFTAREASLTRLASRRQSRQRARRRLPRAAFFNGLVRPQHFLRESKTKSSGGPPEHNGSPSLEEGPVQTLESAALTPKRTFDYRKVPPDSRRDAWQEASRLSDGLHGALRRAEVGQKLRPSRREDFPPLELARGSWKKDSRIQIRTDQPNTTR